MLYVPAFNTMKDFHYKPIPPDHSVPHTYKASSHLNSLDSLVPLLFPNTPQAHKLTEAAPQTPSFH